VFVTFLPIAKNLISPALGLVLNLGSIVSGFMLKRFTIFILKRSKPCSGQLNSTRRLATSGSPTLSRLNYLDNEFMYFLRNIK